MSNGKVYVARPTDRAIKLATSAKGMRAARRIGRVGMVKATAARYGRSPIHSFRRTVTRILRRRKQLETYRR